MESIPLVNVLDIGTRHQRVQLGVEDRFREAAVLTHIHLVLFSGLVHPRDYTTRSVIIDGKVCFRLIDKVVPLTLTLRITIVQGHHRADHTLQARTMRYPLLAIKKKRKETYPWLA